MLILTRGKGQSIMIGDDLMLTVVEIEPVRASILIQRRVPDKSFFHDVTKAWFKLLQPIPLDATIECAIRHLRGDRIRLGFDAPGPIKVHRKEVYDLLRQQQQAGGGEQGKPPLPS